MLGVSWRWFTVSTTTIGDEGRKPKRSTEWMTSTVSPLGFFLDHAVLYHVALANKLSSIVMASSVGELSTIKACGTDFAVSGIIIAYLDWHFRDISDDLSLPFLPSIPSRILHRHASSPGFLRPAFYAVSGLFLH